MVPGMMEVPLLISGNKRERETNTHTFVMDLLLNWVKPYCLSTDQCNSSMHGLIPVLAFHYLSSLGDGTHTMTKNEKCKSDMLKAVQREYIHLY